MTNFYCRKICGDPDSTITEWNEAHDMCEAWNIIGDERKQILHPDPCKEQCFVCMADVGERQKQTKDRIEKHVCRIKSIQEQQGYTITKQP